MAIKPATLTCDFCTLTIHDGQHFSRIEIPLPKSIRAELVAYAEDEVLPQQRLAVQAPFRRGHGPAGVGHRDVRGLRVCHPAEPARYVAHPGARGYSAVAGREAAHRRILPQHGASVMMTCCKHYKRPAGVLGGPCLNCGASQPEHVKQPPGTFSRADVLSQVEWALRMFKESKTPEAVDVPELLRRVHAVLAPAESEPDFKSLVEQFTLSAHLWEAEAVLRQVWNARGAADLAAIFSESITALDGNSEESDDAMRDAIRKLDR